MINHKLLDPPNRYTSSPTSRTNFPQQQQQQNHHHVPHQHVAPPQHHFQQQFQHSHAPNHTNNNYAMNKARINSNNNHGYSYTSPTLYEGSPDLNRYDNIPGPISGEGPSQAERTTPYGLFPTPGPSTSTIVGNGEDHILSNAQVMGVPMAMT